MRRTVVLEREVRTVTDNPTPSTVSRGDEKPISFDPAMQIAGIVIANTLRWDENTVLLALAYRDTVSDLRKQLDAATHRAAQLEQEVGRAYDMAHDIGTVLGCPPGVRVIQYAAYVAGRIDDGTMGVKFVDKLLKQEIRECAKLAAPRYDVLNGELNAERALIEKNILARLSASRQTQEFLESEKDSERLNFLERMARLNTPEQEEESVVMFDQGYEEDTEGDEVAYENWRVMGQRLKGCGAGSCEFGESTVSLRDAIDNAMKPALSRQEGGRE